MNKHILGLGGFFIKTDNPKVLNEWYSTHFGWISDGYGFSFESGKQSQPMYQVLSFFSKESDYFKPSNAQSMLNIRVSDIEACKAYCLANGITVVDEIESFEYGKFLHILDPDQNKIELWEPNDSVYETMVGDKKNKLK